VSIIMSFYNLVDDHPSINTTTCVVC